MAEALLLVMMVAATLYAVLGGADFGAGLIELLLPEAQRKHVDVAIAPVWEANHVWLVLLAVLAFVGFPAWFTTVCTYLHIPIILALLGIVARGSAFTFRHYDPGSRTFHGFYSWAFRLGSLLTPLSLGIIVAACVQGTLDDDPARGAFELFVAPWNTPFCWATGAFVCALFAFEGAALLAAEQAGPTGPLPLVKLARNLHGLSMLLGLLVLAAAYSSGLPWFRAFFNDSMSLTSLGVASVLTPVVAVAFRRGMPWLVRVSVGGQVALVLAGLVSAQYPVLLRMQHRVLTLQEAAAPSSTLRALWVAVGVGLMVILPALFYLLRVTKGRAARDAAEP